MFPNFLRTVAALALICGVALIVVAAPHVSASTMVASAEAIAVGFGLLVVSVVAIGVAGLIDAAIRRDAKTTSAPMEVMLAQLGDIQRRVDDIAVIADRLARTRQASVELPDSGADAAKQLSAQLNQAIAPALQMLNELRDLSLLTDDERKQRLAVMDEERMQVLLKDAVDNIEHRRWSAADHVLLTLEREFAAETEVRRARNYFDDARRNAEVDTVNETRDQVEMFLNASSYDKAHQLASRLCSDFPGSVVAQSLLSRVTLERDTFSETSIARMIDELRNDVDRKLWRRALMHLHHLIEKYPDHPKVRKVRNQLETVQANAEIEERQELEVQIQELIRNREFGEAIHQSEELLRRFPNSPQAEAIETLLPRIRELASEDETDVPAPI
jgi:outer membrane protein assembly factor BamD (BamD/ComL family)